LDIYRQGSLDALCGVYAFVNSITLLVPKKIKSKKLFSYIIRKMGNRLPAVMLEGLSTKEMLKLVLTPSVTFCAKHHVNLRYTTCSKDIVFGEFWQLMQQHIATHGSGSIVLGIAGTHDHWTCVRRVTDKSMLLVDSDDMARIHRRHVSLGDAGRHRLHPKDTFFLKIDGK